MSHRWLIRGFGIALVIAIVLAGFGNAVRYLWNDLATTVFGLHALSYWQAVELLGLCWILFGSWRAFPRFRGAANGTRWNRSMHLNAADKEAVQNALQSHEIK